MKSGNSRHFRWQLVAGLLLPVLGATAQQPLAVPPVHRFTFDQPAGAVATGTVVLDSIGTAHASVRGTGASATGAGLRLPGGSSTTAAYIDLPNGIASGSARQTPGYAEASYEVWVTIHSNQNWSRILDFGSNQSGEIAAPGGTFNGQDYLILSANKGTAPDVRFERGGLAAGDNIQDTAGATTPGVRVHYVVTYDAAAGAWLLYKNGALLKTMPTLLGPGSLPDVNAWLGRSNWAGDANADATYDEFRIYDHALTAQQVLGNFQAGPDTLTSPAAPTGPLVHYNLDESNGTSAADASGNGNPATLSNATFQAGLLGNAATLNGSNARLRTAASITLPEPARTITLAAWIKPADWSGNRRIIQKGAADNQYRLLAENGLLKFELAAPARTVTAPLPATGVWTHVAGTYDGANLRLHLNGSVVATLATTGPLAVSADPLFVGTKSATAAAGDHFSGLIDDVRIYDRPLSSAEINTLATVSSIAATDPAAQLGTADGGTFTITRTGSTAAPLAVNFSVLAGAGQASAGRYALAPSAPSIVLPAGQASATVTVTPSSDAALLGTQAVTLDLAAGTGYAVSNSSSAAVQLLDSPFNAWKVLKFGSLAAAQAPSAADDADTDHDGWATIIEYYLDAHPLQSDAKLPAPVVEGNFLTLTYTRLKHAVGVTAAVEWSDQLTGWTSSGVTEELLADDGVKQSVKAKVPLGTESSRFLLLRVTRP